MSHVCPKQTNKQSLKTQVLLLFSVQEGLGHGQGRRTGREVLVPLMGVPLSLSEESK